MTDGVSAYTINGTSYAIGGGTPSTVTVSFASVSGDDGYVLESSETSNVGGSVNSSNSTILVGDDKTRKQYKAIVSFDTFSLPDTAQIQRATLKVTQSTVSSAPWWREPLITGVRRRTPSHLVPGRGQT